MFGFPMDTTLFLWILPLLVAGFMFYYTAKKNKDEEN